MAFALRLLVPPREEPVTLEEAKQHCRISIDDDDELLRFYIQAAREHVEIETRRQLLTATWVLAFDGFPCHWDRSAASCFRGWSGGQCIEIPRYPLQSVTGVAYTDIAGATQTLDTLVYGVDVLSEPGRVYLKEGQGWPSTGTVPNAVQITFVAGHVAAGQVPRTLKQAILLLVGSMYEFREALAEKAALMVPGLDALLWNNKVGVL